MRQIVHHCITWHAGFSPNLKSFSTSALVSSGFFLGNCDYLKIMSKWIISFFHSLTITQWVACPAWLFIHPSLFSLSPPLIPSPNSKFPQTMDRCILEWEGGKKQVFPSVRWCFRTTESNAGWRRGKSILFNPCLWFWGPIWNPRGGSDDKTLQEDLQSERFSLESRSQAWHYHMQRADCIWARLLS